MGSLLNDVLQTDAAGDGRANRQKLVVVKDVLQTDLHRAHTQCLGQLVHLCLGGEVSLGRTKTPERAARQVVGVDCVGIDANVRELVGAGAGECGVAQYFVAGVHIGACVAYYLYLGGDQFSVTGSAPFGFDEHWMPFAVAND